MCPYIQERNRLKKKKTFQIFRTRVVRQPCTVVLLRSGIFQKVWIKAILVLRLIRGLFSGYSFLMGSFDPVIHQIMHYYFHLSIYPLVCDTMLSEGDTG